MPAARQRLTRVEQQEQTRERIVAAAARVFARRGFAASSLDDIAADAGYTKGAVYSNFGSKDDLFLAVLDARYTQWLEQIAAALDAEDTPSAGLDAVSRFCSAIDRDREWCLLSVEFSMHAARDRKLRAKLAAHSAAVRGRIATLIETKAAEFGLPLPGSAEDLAAAALALADGLALQRLAQPSQATNDALFGSMLGRMLGIDTLKLDANCRTERSTT
jgi:AcrR family transcriptional regulator